MTNILLFRQLFKQINRLSKFQAFLAQKVQKNVKIHHQIFKQQTKYMENKKKKQQDHQLLQAFLNFMKRVNIYDGKFQTVNSRKILIQCCFGQNIFLDENFILKKEQVPKQILKLHQNQQFQKLSKPQDKQLIIDLIKKIFLGEQTYTFKNLTDFFNQQKSQKNLKEDGSFYDKLSQQTRHHLQQVFLGKISIGKQYRFLYQAFFTKQYKLQCIYESYLRSDYIIADFDLQIQKLQQTQLNIIKGQAQAQQKIKQKRLKKKDYEKESLSIQQVLIE